MFCPRDHIRQQRNNAAFLGVWRAKLSARPPHPAIVGDYKMHQSTAERPSLSPVNHHRKSLSSVISCTAIAALLCGGAFLVPAQAEFVAKDAQVMARVMGFMDQPPPATVNLGIVYDAGSEKQAEALKALLGGSFAAGKFTLVPTLVKIGDVGSANVNAVVLMAGVGGAAKVAEITKSKKIPCFTGDSSQVKSGACLIGINTDPKVEILLNKSLAASSGISFGAAFKMMITEI